MTDLSSKSEMQDEFHRLTDQKAQIEKELAPLLEKRDSRLKEHRDWLAKMNAKIRSIKEPLFEIDMKRGALVRALKGDTGKRKK